MTRFFGWLLVSIGMALPVWAATGIDTKGSAGLGLALQMYCGTYNVLTGNLGLLLGLLLATYGLWVLISDGAFGKGISIVIAGALLTALPGLTSSFFQGVGDYLYTIGISTTSGGPLRIATDIAERSGCSGIDIDWNDFDLDAPNYWQKGGGASMGAPDYKGQATGKYKPPVSMTGKDTCIAEPPNPACIGAKNTVMFQNFVPISGKLNSCFGLRDYKPSPYHSGIDISCAGRQTPIYAGVSGVVTTEPGIGSKGRYNVWISGNGGNYMFNHMLRNSSTLRKGQSVGSNDIIGTCSNDGTEAIHLHVEFWPTSGTPCKRIDPFGRLPSGGPPSAPTGR